VTGRRTILVSGATGAQGGSVACHLLKSGRYAVRCLTRNPESEKAKALASAGAEVFRGDFDDVSSLEPAVSGCDAVFGLTSYWEHFEKGYQQGKNLIDVVVAANVEHFVLSSLPHAEKISRGELAVPHFDTEARLEDYARKLQPDATFVHVAFYFENFLTCFAPRRDPEGGFSFGFPQGDVPLAGVAVGDIGGVVMALFDGADGYRRRTVGVVGDDLTPREYGRIMTRVLGRTILYKYVPRGVFAALDFPGAEDLANMFEFNRLYVPHRKADLALSRELYPPMRSFEAWLEANRQAFDRRWMTDEAEGSQVTISRRR
jgi:uncharacterized protein YbjT (DUF2867 family)